ncbi:hypothetical protein NDU88_005884 [Pleurodeles waltl]|uniref:Uncharacterized protein n=1 Tax=Pleurodeles waltl TaxID=8319 RepID=A0AAV7MCB1_PLEWA|nr:hypothetical protein NDU88_005884 [Pleurodeles waltl]
MGTREFVRCGAREAPGRGSGYHCVMNMLRVYDDHNTCGSNAFFVTCLVQISTEKQSKVHEEPVEQTRDFL